MSFEPHYVNTYIIYCMIIWLVLIILSYILDSIYNICRSINRSSEYSDSYAFINEPSVSNAKTRRIKSIIDNHFKQTIPKKYQISLFLKIRCKRLRVRLYWSQWKSKTLNGIKKHRSVCKPPEFLELECKRRENIL
jgi:hypothetical protein